MRWMILVLICLFPLQAFSVTAEVKGITKDDSRNIYWVNVEYTIGSDKIMNPYPIAARAIIYMTQQEINQLIERNVKNQCHNYIAHEFFLKNTQLPSKLNNLIGQSITETEAIVSFDFDKDGVIDKQYKIKEDGTYVEIPINP